MALVTATDRWRSRAQVHHGVGYGQLAVNPRHDEDDGGRQEYQHLAGDPSPGTAFGDGDEEGEETASDKHPAGQIEAAAVEVT